MTAWLIIGVFIGAAAVLFVDWMVGGIPRSPQTKDDDWGGFPRQPRR